MLVLSIISFVVALSILVIVHEWGHFLMARRAGIPVERFSIGFGPRLFGWKNKETDFCVSVLPLGGYVKLQGEEGEEEARHLPDAFPNKSVWQRFQVVVAGPIMNLLFAFFLLPLVFWIGHNVPKVLAEKPVVQERLADSPATQAGLQIGDRLLGLDEKQFQNWEEVLQTVGPSSGKEVVLKIKRGTNRLQIPVRIEPFLGKETGYLGVEPWLAKSQAVVITQVNPESPAGRAGFLAKDRVLKIDQTFVANLEDMKRRVQRANGKELTFTIERTGEVKTVGVVPQYDASMEQWLIGIQGEPVLLPQQLRRYAFFAGLQAGWKEAVKLTTFTLGLVKRLVTLELSYKTLGGPVQIAYSLAKASASGLNDFLYFVAFLSIQLGILNLLPIPVLDGGHIVFLGMEAVLRKPLSIRTRLVAQQIGMALLLTLILFVTFNDLDRLLGIRSWFH